MKAETARAKLKDEAGMAYEWNGRAPKFVVVGDPGYYGFFSRAGAEAFLASELKGKGTVEEITNELP